MYAHNDGTNSAVARMHALVKHARVALAVTTYLLFVHHANNLAQVNLRSRARKVITTLCSSERLHKPSLAQNPQKFSRVRNGNALAPSHLRERQRLAILQASQLHQASKPVFFLRRNLHQIILKFQDLKGLYHTLLLSQD